MDYKCYLIRELFELVIGFTKYPFLSKKKKKKFYKILLVKFAIDELFLLVIIISKATYIYR